MNREIKFRAKDLQFNIWVYGMPVNSNCGYQMLSDDSLYHIDCAEWNCTSIDINKDTIGEYTGLKDKNGKEIYEGDVLSVGINFTCPVTFEDGCFQLKSSPNQGLSPLCQDRAIRLEVIGNIYENPELCTPTTTE